MSKILAVMCCYVTWVVSAEHCSLNCLYISDEENECDTCSNVLLCKLGSISGAV